MNSWSSAPPPYDPEEAPASPPPVPQRMVVPPNSQFPPNYYNSGYLTDPRDIIVDDQDDRVPRNGYGRYNTDVRVPTNNGYHHNGTLPNRRGIANPDDVNPNYRITNGNPGSRSNDIQPTDTPNSPKSVQAANQTQTQRVREQPEPSDPKDRLPIQRKLALAVGAAPLVFPIVTSTVFINLFLLETAMLTARNVSVVLFVARAFDAISDPIVGVLVNKTQQKRPTLRRWMMAALPFLVGSYFALWLTMTEVDQWIRVVYYTIIYIILQVAFTVYSVPYSALIMYQTNNRRERDVITAFRMTAEIMFGVLAVGIMGGITGGSLDSESCADSKDELALRYIISALVIVGVVLVSGVVTFFGTRERKDIRLASSGTPVWTATKRVMTHKPYVFLMLSYFCMYLAVAIVQGNLQIYFKHSLKKEKEFTYAVIILMATGGLGVPLWQLVLLKWGKKAAVFLGVVVLVPALGSLFFVQEDVNQFVIYGLCFVAGFGLGSGYFMPWSMLPDVVDDYIVKYNESSESIFYGFFVFFNKFAAGIGLGVSVIFLEIAGYKNECGEQNENVDTTLRWLCAPGPAALVLLYALCVALYPLNDKKCLENKEILLQRAKRNKAMKENTEQHVNPAYNYLPEYITAL
ncbi:sodium-dependent lysophosphatidylcholine symporter 1-like isoform X3 [Convolutriloba macropyga]